MGRYSGLTFLGKGHKKLTVLTAYRVCDDTINNSKLGSMYSREWNYLRDTGNDRPDPRASLLADLSKLISQLSDDHHEVILMMDSNEVLDDAKSSGLTQFCQR